MTNLWRRYEGIVVAILFGGLAALAATSIGGLWVPGAGVGTFVLVAGGYLITDRLTGQPEPPPPPDQPDIEEPQAVVPSPEPPVAKQAAVVFVHGILSSAQAWTAFERLIRADADLAALEVVRFQYETGVVRTRPGRRIPDLDTVARRLGTRFEDLERKYRAVVIVSHSMGGLVTQRFVARMLEDGEGTRLDRIKRIVMFACPTAGSDFLRTLRALAPFRHTQERILRTLNAEVTRVQEIILSKVVHAKKVTSQSCPIPLRLYAGESDKIVLPQSALGVYPHRCTGVVAGDHTTIVRPDSPDHESYQVLRTNLVMVLEELGG